MPPAPIAPPPRPGPVADPTGPLLSLFNAARRPAGMAELTLDARLTDSAVAFAAELARRGTLTHQGLNGSMPLDRIARAGIAGVATGEVAAAGQTSAAEVVADWLSDPPHRAIILDPAYARVGFGAATSATGTISWVADFAGPEA